MLMLTNRKEFFHATTLSNWMLINQPFFAIGSGMQFAIAAMEAGKTPYEAVKIASKHDPHTGMGFNQLTM
jgi:ATP-dependent protease HslVU (ClpYQ) peptidase subunit